MLNFKSNSYLKCLVFFILFIVTIDFALAAKFDVSESEIHGVVMSADKYEQVFTLSSLSSQTISLSLQNANWARLDPQFVSLADNDMKEVKITFDSNGLSLGVYVGALKMSGSNYETSIPLIFEVESQDVVVDGSLDIPPQYKVVYLGDRLLAQLRVFDLIDLGDVSLGGTKVDVNYKIVSLDGKTIASDHEAVTFTKSIQISKSVLFAPTTSPGQYVLEANIKYGPSIASSVALFEIKKKSIFDLFSSGTLLRSILNWIMILAGIALLWFIVLQIKEITRLGAIERQSRLKDKVRSVLGT
jgi:hypothetical protein